MGTHCKRVFFTMTWWEDAEHPQPSVGAWATYAANRPHVAPTPHEEVANRIVRNRCLPEGRSRSIKKA